MLNAFIGCNIGCREVLAAISSRSESAQSDQLEVVSGNKKRGDESCSGKYLNHLISLLTTL